MDMPGTRRGSSQCNYCFTRLSVFRRKKICCCCKNYFCHVCIIRRPDKKMCCKKCQILTASPLNKSDLLSLKSRDLVNFLTSRHISTNGCVEKEDLVNLVITSSMEGDYVSDSSSQPNSPSRNSASSAEESEIPIRQPRRTLNENDGIRIYGLDTSEAGESYSSSLESVTSEALHETDWVLINDRAENSQNPVTGRGFIRRGVRVADAQTSTQEDAEYSGLTENQSTETNSTETDSTETDSTETNSTETSSSEAESSEAESSEASPMEDDPAETNPMEADPAETNPTEADPAETGPTETDATGNGSTEIGHAATAAIEFSPSETVQNETDTTENNATETSLAQAISTETNPTDTRREGGHRVVNLSEITCPEDLENMTVKELKILLLANRTDYRGCVERADLVERAKRLWNDYTMSRRDLERLTLEDLCKICMDAPIECVLLECGHMATCMNCGKQLSECPLCRQYVVRCVRTFRV